MGHEPMLQQDMTPFTSNDVLGLLDCAPKFDSGQCLLLCRQASARGCVGPYNKHLPCNLDHVSGMSDRVQLRVGQAPVSQNLCKLASTRSKRGSCVKLVQGKSCAWIA